MRNSSGSQLAVDLARFPDPAAPLNFEYTQPISGLFSEAARRFPTAIAVSDRLGEVTYAELEQWSSGLAHRLVQSRTAKGSIITIYATRSASLVAALLAVGKAGVTICILDPTLPAKRVADEVLIVRPKAFIQLEEAGAVPEEILRAHDEAGCALRISLPPRWESGCGSDTYRPGGQIQVCADDPAYVLFTSGTTGHPKAIVTPQHCLPHFMHWYHRTMRVRQDDRFTMFSGLGHDTVMRDIFVPLTAGARICIPDAGFLRDSVALSGWMSNCKPTVAHLTPTLASMLVAAAGLSGAATITSLRYLLLGGEMLSFQGVEKLRQIAPNAAVLNCYGATETPQIAACYTVPERLDRQHLEDRVPIGQGIDDEQVLVLTDEQHLAEPDEEGEIYVRTPYLSLGYLNDAEATARRFLPNPFRRQQGGESVTPERDLIYRTGDRGRWDEHGVVTCLGRIDNQIKIRGFRIELEEIEVALRSIKGIRMAAVIPRESVSGNKQLVGFIETESIIPEERILLQLRERLPAYMVPARIVILTDLPRNANGKTDRRALVQMSFELPVVQPRGSTNLTATEALLAGIWEQILSVKKIGKEDDFFELGGDSLAAVELLVELEQKFGKRLANADLIRASTLQEVARTIETTPMATPFKLDDGAPEVDIVTLWAEGDREPVYWIPGGSGLSVVAFREVSKLLQAQRPVHGLVSSVSAASRLSDLRARAAKYVEAIRLHQPEGPYHLLGYSFGSWLAFEMAMQMTEAGLTVGVLGVFDMEVPRALSLAQWLAACSKLSWRHGIRLLRLPARERREYVQTQIKPSYWNLRRRMRQFREGKNGLGDAYETADRLNRQATRAYVRTMSMEPFPGRIDVILAECSIWSVLEEHVDPRAGWSKLAGKGVAVHHAPGSHLSMINHPNVETLTALLREIFASW